ncbi:Asp-tRNA(Asn)/Glu-tRNA(Gln) amidotransferase subunit GatA [Roseospira marina]|uniref:Glutamyl-tRNA(Gln) amidotransferase subunit A n=1 Tax=Roseospira marina TaxID=140057 RepID=A0A5M6IF14_9PROT|nr:Asp-tRNA(Asn)/Glu-tRNA(Gln) amidotransferase subunit GatA [Roseospira marina]KAA5606870.1 Asp-tRNA(Asn)/Glu-tRNA(Gln) amidotransferase subunit GatA [Roseospira marina]MBB4312962.1 aspartyl-tRNA(Asn)/glutamyl-tRNA(Gln) amidotransferase subunit A [Roseospira marina]MBB5086265.1 aspartyl-tRNA(Asn)/glutamyl-tRNA(Gln) amidotransferase subunit A [Roseospira marina]
MITLTDLTIAEARKGLDAKTFTAAELTDAHIAAMEARADLNAYVLPTPDRAREMAAASDARIAKGKAGAMEGIPIAMKDLFCTDGTRTTAGSKILGNFVPPYESTVSANLWSAGAVLLGKANLDEFAMGSTNQTSAFGDVVNPWTRTDEPTRKLVPGGSSGGSAAAVAGRIALGATGTDTGGSIRQPASFCGIVGLKPTYGRCSRWGIVAFASSLDQAGPMARTVEDVAIMLGAMAGHDPKDSTSAPIAVPDFTAALEQGVKGLKVGIPREYRPEEGLSPEIDAIWTRGMEMLKDAGAEPVDISLPHTKYALATYYIIAPAEASSNLARYDGVRYGLRVLDEGDGLNDMYMKTRGAGFGAEVKRRILIGTYALSAGYYDAYYLKAQKVRSLIARDFKAAFDQGVDVILTPATPSAAFPLDDAPSDPVTMYLNDVFTVPTSLAGLPGLSVPVALTEAGLPQGLQLIGRPFDEETVLRAGRALEKAAAFTATPSLLEG